MDKTREEFIIWIRSAINNKQSVAYEELYQFLVACFVRADVDGRGKVDLNKFDSLIEEAAELPRRYGYAPSSDNLFPSEGLRKAARAKQFLDMDIDNSGYITLDKWVAFAVKHITSKVAGLPKDYLGGSADNVSKEEFLAFMRKAVDRSTPEYKELYFFLLETFQAGDVKRTGEVDPIAFDKMIEAAAAAPRRYGLAPKTSDLFPNEGARLAKRKEYFSTMDTNANGTISFDEWLNYAYKHIVGKVKGL